MQNCPDIKIWNSIFQLVNLLSFLLFTFLSFLIFGGGGGDGDDNDDDDACALEDEDVEWENRSTGSH